MLEKKQQIMYLKKNDIYFDSFNFKSITTITLEIPTSSNIIFFIIAQRSWSIAVVAKRKLATLPSSTASREYIKPGKKSDKR